MPFSRRFLQCVTLVTAAVACAIGAAPASAYRGVPQAMYNVNNQVMNSSNYTYALRFVADKTGPMYRFFSGFNLEGSQPIGGRAGYALGTGGTIEARLVAIKADGTPDLANVLARETVSAVTRLQETKSAYAVPAANQLLYFNTGGVTLTGGRMYAMVYRNVDANPSANWFSENSPTVKAAYAGPNGANTLDPNAPGAIDNLDPREAVAWSTTGGSSWVWGLRVGEGTTSGSYGGSATTDDGTRLPWYGWQSSSTSTPQANQPYYAYTMSGAYTFQKRNDTGAAMTLTQAGGYAPIGKSIGTVTVKNLATGASARTAALAGGLRQGALSSAVTVNPGQTYQVSNSGAVMLSNADSFIRAIFSMGTQWTVQTLSNGPSRANLFAATTAEAATTKL